MGEISLSDQTKANDTPLKNSKICHTTKELIGRSSCKQKEGKKPATANPLVPSLAPPLKPSLADYQGRAPLTRPPMEDAMKRRHQPGALPARRKVVEEPFDPAPPPPAAAAAAATVASPAHLVGAIVEKGFSAAAPSSAPRPTVLPFPVARHRSHGPVSRRRPPSLKP